MERGARSTEHGAGNRRREAGSGRQGKGAGSAYLVAAPDFSLALRDTSGERAGERGGFRADRLLSPALSSRHGKRGSPTADNRGSIQMRPEQGSAEQKNKAMAEKQFRFQDLEIWQRGAALSRPLFALADQLDERKRYRFAEQLRAATLSITNNIAEGSGSTSEPF